MVEICRGARLSTKVENRENENPPANSPIQIMTQSYYHVTAGGMLFLSLSYIGFFLFFLLILLKEV